MRQTEFFMAACDPKTLLVVSRYARLSPVRGAEI